MDKQSIDKFESFCNDMMIANESYKTMRLTYQNFEMESQKFVSQIKMEQNLRKQVQIYQDYYNRVLEFQQTISNDTYNNTDKLINISQIIGSILIAIPTGGIGLIGLSARRGAYKNKKTKTISDLLFDITEKIQLTKYLISKGYKTTNSIANLKIKEMPSGGYQIYEKIDQTGIKVIEDEDGALHIYKKLSDSEYVPFHSGDSDDFEDEYVVYKIIN